MTTSAPIAHMSFADYLAAERASESRHEFLAGAVFAIAGGTPEHGALAAAVMGEFRSALWGKPCRVFSSDVRIRIAETNLATYPDVCVVCGALETASDDADAIANPTALVEVLSSATEAYDRGAKAAHYRRISSLREYVFVAQDEARIEVYRRGAKGSWELFEARRGETLELASLGITLDVNAVYENPLTARAEA